MSKPIKVLFAEDEPTLGKIVKESLESRDFEVIHCQDGEEAWRQYTQAELDILVLDVMMPKLDGFSLARKVRKENTTIPIIFLTAKSRTEDVVEGFEQGGNDYLKKPFSMEELIVRIKALISRKIAMPPNLQTELQQYTIGKLLFDYPKQQLTWGDTTQGLTHREAAVLLLLAQSPNKLVEKTLILNNIWGTNDFYASRNLDVYITKLRKKLKPDPSIEIVNIRGYGYKLLAD